MCVCVCVCGSGQHTHAHTHTHTHTNTVVHTDASPHIQCEPHLSGRPTLTGTQHVTHPVRTGPESLHTNQHSNLWCEETAPMRTIHTHVALHLTQNQSHKTTSMLHTYNITFLPLLCSTLPCQRDSFTQIYKHVIISQDDPKFCWRGHPPSPRQW